MIALELAILLFAAVMVAEAAGTIRLTDSSQGPRHAYIGELIQVGLRVASPEVISTDESVVKPFGVTNGSPSVHYFVAAFPGKATLRARSNPCPRCLVAATYLWNVEIDVG